MAQVLSLIVETAKSYPRGCRFASFLASLHFRGRGRCALGRFSAQNIRDLEPAALKLCRDSDRVRRAFVSGPFGDGSWFVKTLKSTLTLEQSDALDEAARNADEK